MDESEQITIQKKELPRLKNWLKSKNKKILRLIELGKESIRVIVSKN
jgi:hypothetical protein